MVSLLLCFHSQGLAENAVLETLDLADNEIGNSGAAAARNMLMKNRALKDLNVLQCSLQPDDAAAIMEAAFPCLVCAMCRAPSWFLARGLPPDLRSPSPS